MRVVVKHPGEAPTIEEIDSIEEVLGEAHHVAWTRDQVTVHAMNDAEDFNLIAPVSYRLPVCGPIVAVPGDGYDADFVLSVLVIYCDACAQMAFAMN